MIKISLIRTNPIVFLDNGFKEEDENVIEITEEEYKLIKTTHPKCLKYENGKIIVDNEEQIKMLRQRREKECFSIINRGQLWYSTLTAEQYRELQVWYQAWLDVTKTLVIPERPSWLE